MACTFTVKPNGKGFTLHFQNSRINLCIHQMIELLRNICIDDRHIFEMGFFHSLHLPLQRYETTIEYRLFFGRLYVLLSQRELVEFLSSLWIQNQTLMNFIYADVLPRQEEHSSHQPTKITLQSEAIG